MGPETPTIIKKIDRGAQDELKHRIAALVLAYKRALDKLTRFLEYHELELSNNLAENSMRPVALGRRNWIHIRERAGGPKIAAIHSVVESCRRLKFPVREYLAAVLPGLTDCPIQRLPELTPAAMATQRC